MFDQRSVLSCCLSALAICASVHADAVQWRVEDGGNGHWYAFNPTHLNWSVARSAAVLQGGHLACVGSSTENAFLRSLVPNGDAGYLGAIRTLSGWAWVTGETFGYTNWNQGEPNGVTPGEVVWLERDSGGWNDHTQAFDVQGALMEWSADCNDDGIVDYGQCRDGTLPDFNGNNIPDCCELGQVCVVGSYPVQWREDVGGDGHWYEPILFPDLVGQDAAAVAALGRGASLAQIETEPKNRWIAARFAARIGNPIAQFWTSGTRVDGTWRWGDGSEITFLPWNCNHCDASCQPDSGCETGLTIMCLASGLAYYNNVSAGCFGAGERGAVLEWSADCNNDGLVDYGQILNGQLADANGNGVPEVCECPTDSDGDSVLDCVDGCPNDPSKTAPGACGCGVSDTDTDADGAADCIDGCPTDPSKTSPGICGCGVSDADSDGDGAADCVDGCPTDPGKIAPGVCGCGSPDLDADSDGRTDCRDVNLHLSVTAIDLHPGGIVAMRVEAQTLQPVVEIIGLQAALTFDATRLRVLGITPAASSPLSTELSEVIDQTAGTIRYAIGAMPPASGMTLGVAVFDIMLQFHASADLCATVELARLATVNGFGSRLAARDGTSIQPSDSWDTTRQLDVTGPDIYGLPAPTTVPHDAGNTAGATLDEWQYWPSITDPCGFTYERLVQLPDGTWNQWYWPSSFPTGTSTVLWRATDNLGNSSEASTTITVEPYQLLDCMVTLVGAFDPSLPPFNRTIRIEVGSMVLSQALAFGSSGSEGRSRTAELNGLQLPVQAGTPCARAKDVAFSLTDATTTLIENARYKASFALRQGDSNDDDAVNIIDYGIWYIDFGPAAMTDRSNFNADGFVNNADFAWLGLHIFQRGETCGGFVPGSEPLRRISVKELRRRGLGDLDGADLNRDGWLDMRDVQAAMSGGTPPNPVDPRATEECCGLE